MVTTQRATPQIVCEVAKKSFSTANLISALAGMCENRFHAISAYPHARSAAGKFESIRYIRAELAAAKAMPNTLEQVKACLRLERRLLSIAPTATSKLYATYVAKVNSHMASCREYLGWAKQF